MANTTPRFGAPNTDNTYRSAFRTFVEADYSLANNATFQPNSDYNIVYVTNVTAELIINITSVTSYIGDQTVFIVTTNGGGPFLFRFSDGINDYQFSMPNKSTNIFNLIYTLNGWIWTNRGSGGPGGITIGDIINGSNPNAVLFVDSANNLQDFGAINGITLTMDDANQVLTFLTSGFRQFYADYNNHLYGFGDVDNNYQGTAFTINDNDNSWNYNNIQGGGVKITSAASTTVRNRIEPDKDGTYAMLTDIPGGGGTEHFTSTNITIGNGIDTVLYDPVSVTTNGTIIFQTTPNDGDEVLISFGGTISAPGAPVAINMGFTLNPPQIRLGIWPTSALVGDSIRYKYRADLDAFYIVSLNPPNVDTMLLSEQATQSGVALTTSYAFSFAASANGRTIACATFTPTSADAASIPFYISISGQTVTVNFTSQPPLGTNNLNFAIMIKLV